MNSRRFHWSEDGLCLGAAVTDATGEMLETFSALFPGVGHGQVPPPALSLRTSLKRVDSPPSH